MSSDLLMGRASTDHVHRLPPATLQRRLRFVACLQHQCEYRAYQAVTDALLHDCTIGLFYRRTLDFLLLMVEWLSHDRARVTTESCGQLNM